MSDTIREAGGPLGATESTTRSYAMYKSLLLKSTLTGLQQDAESVVPGCFPALVSTCMQVCLYLLVPAVLPVAAWAPVLVLEFDYPLYLPISSS